MSKSIIAAFTMDSDRKKVTPRKTTKVTAAKPVVTQEDALAAAGRATKHVKNRDIALLRATVIAQMPYFRTADDAANLVLEMLRTPEELANADSKVRLAIIRAGKR